MENFSYLSNAEPAYIENLYQQFKKNPSSVDVEWKKFFEGFDFAVANASEFDVLHNGDEAAQVDKEKQPIISGNGEQLATLRPTAGESDTVSKEFQVARLITAYR